MGSDVTDIYEDAEDEVKKAKPGYRIGKESERFYKKHVKDPFEIPEFPGVEFPEEPEFDAGRDLALKNALLDRIRRSAIRGRGIADTIKTSPLGVTKRAPVLKKTLRGE